MLLWGDKLGDSDTYDVNDTYQKDKYMEVGHLLISAKWRILCSQGHRTIWQNRMPVTLEGVFHGDFPFI